MRLLVRFNLNDGGMIENDEFSYIGGFVSFLKSIFGDNMYLKKEYRPYVWSVYFGRDFKIEKDKPTNPPKKIDFILSTGNLKLITKFWNGLLNLKLSKKNICVSGLKYEVENVTLLPFKKIKSSKVRFKTLSPIVLNDDSKEERSYGSFYLPTKEDVNKFEKLLVESLKKKYEFLIKDKFLFSANDVSITNLSNIKEVVVPYKNGYLRCFKCEFDIQAPSKILQFAYDYGVGVRNGQGFGMLEEIKG